MTKEKIIEAIEISPRMQKALDEIERILKEMEIKELKRMKQKTTTIVSSKMRKIKTTYSLKNILIMK